MIPLETVDVTITNSSKGLNLAKHTAVMFKIDHPLVTDELVGVDNIDETDGFGLGLKPGYGKKTNGPRIGNLAGGSKIPKAINIGQRNRNKFKYGNSHRLLLKETMAHLAKALSTSKSTITGVNVISLLLKN